jgi:hypothetical protein
LKEDEIDEVYFQQDSTVDHTARMSTALLDELFADRTISTTTWPPKSLDLSSLDFLLWVIMKSSVRNCKLLETDSVPERLFAAGYYIRGCIYVQVLYKGVHICASVI